MAEQITPVTDDETPFTSHLIEIDKGRVEADATTAIGEAIRAVLATRKEAKIILTVTVAPYDLETFDDTGALVVTGEVKPVLPRVKRAPAFFFVTADGRGMSRDDPNRDDLRY